MPLLVAVFDLTAYIEHAASVCPNWLVVVQFAGGNGLAAELL
jgi:hypothetical protein